MSKLRIQHKNPVRYGQLIGVPTVGEVQLPEDGIIEVEPEVAEILVNNADCWQYIDQQDEDTDDDDTDEGDFDEEGGLGDEGDDNDDDADEGGEEEEIVAEEQEKLGLFFESTYSIKDMKKIMEDENYEPLDNKLKKSEIALLLAQEYENFQPKTKAEIAEKLKEWNDAQNQS